MVTTWVSSSAYKKEDKFRLRGAAYEKLLDYILPTEIDSKEVKAVDAGKTGGISIEIDHINNDKAYTPACNGVVENSFHQAFVEINHGDEDKLETALTGIQFNYGGDTAMNDELPHAVAVGGALGQGADFYWYWGYYWLAWTCRFCNPSNDDDPNYPYLTMEDENNQFLTDHHAEFESKVKDILVASDCAAFDDITAVHISYETPSSFEDSKSQTIDVQPAETDSKEVKADDAGKTGGISIEIDHINNEKEYTPACNGVVENSFHQAFVEINHGDEDKLETALTGIQFNYGGDTAMNDELPHAVAVGGALGQGADFYWYWGYYWLAWTCRFCNPSNDDDPNYPYLTMEDENNQFLTDHHAEFESKVKDILVASDCAAFDDITAVHISYETPSSFEDSKSQTIDVQPAETDSKEVKADDAGKTGGISIEIDHINNDKAYTPACNGVVENSFHQAFVEINHGDEDKLETALTGIQFNYGGDTAMNDELPHAVAVGGALGQGADFYWYWGYYWLAWTCRFCNPSNDDDPNYPYLTMEDENNQFLTDHHAEFESKVKDILVASDCAAFDDITAVHISYQAASGEDVMAAE
eukprot:CAMPEP_0194262256 /NCGR_PEP_ID=MMETSP0158-20130606/46447_1 /TAXON_ID=33649 /ORGANISM="Thalassionema nitzschioides, Strain L26-B" /LENGTH=585 /DNA_ID=CAMNT_0039002409 /DNA_START=101 /DNA_END=1858 /DNA_ORIENTATION=-